LWSACNTLQKESNKALRDSQTDAHMPTHVPGETRADGAGQERFSHILRLSPGHKGSKKAQQGT